MEKKKKEGKKYRQLYGVEFYFVPSLKTWQEQYEAHRAAVQAERDAKKQEKLLKSPRAVFDLSNLASQHRSGFQS